MTENQGSAAAVLGGEGNPGAGANAGGSGQGSDGAAPPANFDWKSHGIDEAGMNLITTKGFKGPSDLLTSYVNAEKLIGGDKVAMPKDGDEAGWNALYSKLGRPEKADGYKLPVPEGVPGDFAKAAGETFHKLGLSAKQAEGIGAWWNEAMKGQATAGDAAFKQQTEADLGAIKTAWGNAYDQNVEIARRAARQFGVDGDEIGKLERAIGTKRTFELLHKIGVGLGEDQGVNGGAPGSSSFRMTPDQAKAEIGRLKTDEGFVKAWLDKGHPGHKEALAKMENLHKAMAQ